MYGLILGLGCGAAELFLLRRVLLAAGGGQSGKALLLIFLKLALMAAVFAAVLLFFPKELLWCGVGASGALVAGSVSVFVIGMAKDERGKD